MHPENPSLSTPPGLRHESRGRRLAYRVSVFGGATAILTFPISVSISQGGLVLALAGWLAWALLRPRKPVAGDGGIIEPSAGAQLPLVRHPALIFALLVYGVELVSLLINAFESNDFVGFLARGYRSELKDVFLVTMAFWTAAYAADPDQRKRLERWLLIALAILIVSGLVSIFSIYRLQKIPYHLMYGWEPGPNARLQHHLGTLFAGSAAQLHLYMPIGVMNTHLTYGGLLMMFFPVLVFRALTVLLGDVRAANNAGGFRTLLQPRQWIWPAALALASLVFILNNGRSAIFGMLLATGVGCYVLARTGWKRRMIRLLPLVALAIVGLVILDLAVEGVHTRFEQIVGALFGQEKHTDFQRVLVWQGALQLAAHNPIFGVGPGNFEPSIIQNVVDYGQAHPHLWVAYELAQRGHAHNDMLHFLTVAGAPALLCYFLFFAFYLRQILRVPGADSNFWKWGPLAVLGAGLFQCYFQDDEILLPFWALVGFALSQTWTGETPSASTDAPANQ